MRKKDINNALKARLLAGSLGASGAWPNVDSDAGKPYFQVQWPSSFRRGGYLVGGCAVFEIGSMSVTVVAETGLGEDAANDIAEAVSDLFPEDLRIAIPNGEIRITAPSDVLGGFADGADWRVPVSVKYEARQI